MTDQTTTDMGTPTTGDAPNPKITMLRKLHQNGLDRRLGNWLCANRAEWTAEGVVGDYIRDHILPLADPNQPEHIFVMTATMYWVGRVIVESPEWIVITDAAWVPDTGRFAGAMGWTQELAEKEASGMLMPEDLPPAGIAFGSEEFRFSEVEPYPMNRPVALAVGGIISASPYPYALPRGQK